MPWYESALFWGFAAAFLAIVLTVGTMVRDLRWLLWVAWPFAVLALWSALRSFEPRRSAWLFIVGGGLVAAGGLTWLHVALGRAVQLPRIPSIGAGQMTTPSAPDFKITLLGGNVFMPDQDHSLTGFALEVRIWNAGGPSIATDWAMSVIVPGQPAVRGQLTSPPPRLTLRGPAGLRVLRESDFSLETNASRAPLRINDPPVQGWLLFYVKQQRARVIEPGTIIEISVSDVRGERFIGRQKMGDWLRR